MSAPSRRPGQAPAAQLLLLATATAGLAGLLAVEKPPDRPAAPKPRHETALTASTSYHAGSTAELTCKVQSVKSLTETAPLAADVTVELVGRDAKTTALHAGKTGADGLARVRFQIPDVLSGQYTLLVKTKSTLGEEALKRPVTVISTPKVLLTSDKPLYQPGQTMHLRALALRAFDLAPSAKQSLTFEVEDAKGNKVYKRELPTSEFGIASADFTLADEVNAGEYRVRATLGDQRAEKTVTVKKYVLPKFKVELKTDKSFYLPKETIKGTLQVDYFFGKPVAGGQVEIDASTFDVAFKKFTTFKGTTDKAGHLKFEVALPDYFVGTPLAKGDAIVKLDAKVTDTAEHAEVVTRTCPVSDKPIRLSFLPEGGRLIPGLQNKVFVAALYPDGSPASCSIDVYLGRKAEGKPLASAKTSATGLAELTLTPKAEQFRAEGWGPRPVELLGGTQQRWSPANLFDFSATASDDKGTKVTATAALTSEPLGENVLLRLDKAICKGGETLRLDVLTSTGLPTAYVDVVKSGQTMLTQWLDVMDGKASTSLDLPAHVFGTVEVHAYQILGSGEVVRDARIIYVNPASDLSIKVTPDLDVYQPGANGIIRFEVKDGQGKPAPAALGVLVVDEAVYALQEMQPGLEKVFFTLQEEMLKPAVQAGYRPGEGLDTMIRQPELVAARQQSAQALMSVARPKPPPRWQVDPSFARRQKLQEVLPDLADALFRHSMSRPALLVQEKDKWVYPPDLKGALEKAGGWNPATLRELAGGEWTMGQLAAVEPGLSPDRLAAAVTQARLEQLHGNFLVHTSNNREKFFRGGKWQFPDDVLSTCATLGGFGVAGTRDGWGREIKLVKRPEKEKNTTGFSQLDQFVLASAGPDGTFGTADDVTYRRVDVETLGWVWWASGREARGGRDGLVWRRGDDQDRLVVQRAGGGRGLGRPKAIKAERGGMPPPAAMPRPTAPERPMEKKAEAPGAPPTGAPQADSPAEPARLREYFPETLLWRPALITDNDGRAALEVPFADSITTWRLTASASSRSGQLGGVTAPLRVFQDFFVDLDLPVALTQNDEVAFPVAVYNYLKTPQAVILELKPEPWFDLIDSGGAKRTLNLEQGQVTSVRYRIKAKKVGSFPLTVEAKGTKLSDAIKRSIEVVPDGRAVEQVYTDRLKGTVTHKVTIPPAAIDDASKLLVKVYPGVISQVVEGMEGMLRMPTGCFEQTSSSAYPNILVVDYIKRSKQGSPALLARAEQFLSAGYQRLLTFERPGGGFDWWGSGEPLVWLSAYGLQEFHDMAKVYPVDRGVIDRTQAWLMKQQEADGTWAKIGGTHGESIERMGDAKLLLTSYVAWSLLDSMPKPGGWEKSSDGVKLRKAIDYVRERAPKEENAYILALAANALAAWDAKDDSTHDALKRVLRKLDDAKARKADWNAVYFPAKGQTLSYGRDDSLIVETTALATLAMLKSGEFTASVNQALTYLVKTKGAHGHWGSTQATILALKAMTQGLGATPPKGATPFAVLVNGKAVASGEVNEKNFDLLQQFDLTPHLKKGDTEVAIEAKGETSLMYQVVGRHFEPHAKLAKESKQIFEVDVAYDRTKLTTADLLKATATVRYRGETATFNVIVDLPIPPGFTVDAGDFAEMVAQKKVQKFSVTARQVTLYLGDVKPGGEHQFVYALKPKYPIKAKAPAAVVYEYYTPANRAASVPVDVVVE